MSLSLLFVDVGCWLCCVRDTLATHGPHIDIHIHIHIDIHTSRPHNQKPIRVVVLPNYVCYGGPACDCVSLSLSTLLCTTSEQARVREREREGSLFDFLQRYLLCKQQKRVNELAASDNSVRRTCPCPCMLCVCMCV